MNNLPALVQASLNVIKNCDTERLLVFTTKGKHVYIAYGDENEAEMPCEDLYILKNKIVIHNHPGCTGQYCNLSEVDIESAKRYKMHKHISICTCGNVDCFPKSKG